MSTENGSGVTYQKQRNLIAVIAKLKRIYLWETHFDSIMRFSTPQLGRLKRNKLSKFYKITMQSKPGDWGSAVHNGEKHWEHLNHTRSDVQM